MRQVCLSFLSPTTSGRLPVVVYVPEGVPREATLAVPVPVTPCRPVGPAVTDALADVLTSVDATVPLLHSEPFWRDGSRRRGRSPSPDPDSPCTSFSRTRGGTTWTVGLEGRIRVTRPGGPETGSDETPGKEEEKDEVEDRWTPVRHGHRSTGVGSGSVPIGD